jgi:hypothetical protein
MVLFLGYWSSVAGSGSPRAAVSEEAAVKKLIALFLGVISLAIGPASAAIVTIDPFALPVPSQNVCTPSVSVSCSGIPTSDGSTDAGVIFGTRWMAITQQFGTDADTADVNQGHVDALSFNNASGSAANLLVRWDGTASDGGFFGSFPSNFGSAPVDLTGGGTNAFFLLQVLFSDQNIPGFPGYTITAYTDATHYSKLEHDITRVNPFPPNNDFTPQDVFFPFGLFTQGAGAAGPVNFTQVRAVDLTIVGYAALDLQIDFLEAGPSPEPGTWVMMGAGLLGLGVLVRRRRA